MKITKDEARIFAALLNDGKYAFSDGAQHHTKEDSVNVFEALEHLEKKIQSIAKDKRRIGRKSHDDINDVIKRYTAKFNKQKHP